MIFSILMLYVTAFSGRPPLRPPSRRWHSHYVRVRASALEHEPVQAPEAVEADELGALPSVGEVLQSIHPRNVAIWVTGRSMKLPKLEDGMDFVDVFRSCAPYIKMHQV